MKIATVHLCRAVVMYDTIGSMERKLIKKRVIFLRKNGLSYGEIKKKINIPKSTLSLWLKSVPLKPEHRKRLYTKQIEILSRGPKSQRERRNREIEGIIEISKSEIGFPLDERSYKLFGAALYWAEGTKTKNFEITNSDPNLIVFMCRWFEKVFGVKPADMKIHLNVYPQQNEYKLKRFWSDLTGVPLANFGKSFVKPLNKGYKKNNLYYGTVKLRVRRGTDLRHRTFGWIQAVLREEVNQKVASTQKKWRTLTDAKRAINLRKPPIT